MGEEVARLCRHKPLLPSQSNKWGVLPDLKAFRSKADLHKGPASTMPRGLHN